MEKNKKMNAEKYRNEIERIAREIEKLKSETGLSWGRIKVDLEVWEGL